MESFDIFYERNIRNPLRKKELEDYNYNNKAYADNAIKEWDANIPQKIKDTYRLIKLRDPQKAEEYLMGERQKEYQSHLRTKIDKGYKLLFKKKGASVYLDLKDSDKVNSKVISEINSSIIKFMDYIKDIIPTKNFKIIITDTSRRNSISIDRSGSSTGVPAYYHDRLIYIDYNDAGDPDYLVHEYAHFLADGLPGKSKQMIEDGYKIMLDNYFRHVKKKKQDNLEGKENEKHRNAIAKKLGLPSPYAFTNADEWFAEIITHWKKIPNNVVTYKFKQAVKTIISRL